MRETVTPFSLALFSTDVAVIREAVTAGVAMLVVDWESVGKEDRQAGADTQINHDTEDDLARVRRATDATVVCRVNSTGAWTAAEVERAIAVGADEILLPMVRAPREVESLLRMIDSRCRAGILIETRDAVRCAADLASLPLHRVYFGLHDFAIEQHTDNIFLPLADGTIERVREYFSIPFGFGGLTLPDRGAPIPCRLLMGEMVRLACGFSFLRRSFFRDIATTTVSAAVTRIRQALARTALRSNAEVEEDRNALGSFVERWPSPESIRLRQSYGDR